MRTGDFHSQDEVAAALAEREVDRSRIATYGAVGLIGPALGPFPGPHADSFQTMVHVLWKAADYEADPGFYAIWAAIFTAYLVLVSVLTLLGSTVWRALLRSRARRGVKLDH